jgi:phospholipid/cholesterol/gamma-HCH transport system substrate-binding protein
MAGWEEQEMSERTNDFKLGLFVLVGFALFASALFFYAGARFFQGKTVMETYVQGTVEGLKRGAPVTLRGVPVGEVRRISFTWNVYPEGEPQLVYIEFSVRNNVSVVPPGPHFAERIGQQVSGGLRARVQTQGLAGVTILALEYVRNPHIYPPLAITWKPRHIYIPSAPGQLNELLASFQTTLDNVKTDLENLSSRTDQLLVQMRGLVDHVDRVAANFDTAALNQTLENARQASAELGRVAHDLKEYPAGALFGRPPPPARSLESSGR